MELTTHKDYFLNFRVIDREIYGVRVMMGAELNVMDFDGTVDLSPKLLNNLDMAIASQHIWCMPQGGGPEENTAAMVLAMDNCPKICILGHPDDGRYPLDRAGNFPSSAILQCRQCHQERCARSHHRRNECW